MSIEKGKSVWLEYAEAIGVAIVLALFIRAFIVQAFTIPSESMRDTLLVGDYLLVNKFGYGPKIPFTHSYIWEGSDPAIGDIIVFEAPDEPETDYIKRIVGVPGDVLEMRNKVLYRNNQLVEEPYTRYIDPRTDPRRDNFGPITVPEGKYFVMGDNRDASLDSRLWKNQFVDRSAIHGKAWRMYWSWDSQGFRPRWGRLGMKIE